LLAELTHTNPLPPPGATGLAAAACAGLSFFPEVAGAAAVGAAAGVGAGLAGAAVAAGVGAGIAAGFAAAAVGAGAAAGAAAYHVCTPLCPRHAPALLAAVEYVPSLQIPFAPAGAPAGACAIALPAHTASAPASIKLIVFIAVLEGLQIGKMTAPPS